MRWTTNPPLFLDMFKTKAINNMIFDSIVDKGSYWLLTSDVARVLIPKSHIFLVDDESGYITLRFASSRKNLGVVRK